MNVGDDSITRLESLDLLNKRSQMLSVHTAHNRYGCLRYIESIAASCYNTHRQWLELRALDTHRKWSTVRDSVPTTDAARVRVFLPGHLCPIQVLAEVVTLMCTASYVNMLPPLIRSNAEREAGSVNVIELGR